VFTAREHGWCVPGFSVRCRLIIERFHAVAPGLTGRSHGHGGAADRARRRRQL